MLNPNAPCYLEEGALGRWSGYEGGASYYYKGINPINGFERSSAPSAMWGHCEKMPAMNQILTRYWICYALILDFSSLQNCEQFLLLINHRIYSILLAAQTDQRELPVLFLGTKAYSHRCTVWVDGKTDWLTKCGVTICKESKCNWPLISTLWT